MKYKLWLDDIRPAPDSSWVEFNNITDMIGAMKRLINWGANIEVISLDNDLGEGFEEGYKVLDWLESLLIPVEFGIHIHTSNSVARERMRAIIERNGWTEVR